MQSGKKFSDIGLIVFFLIRQSRHEGGFGNVWQNTVGNGTESGIMSGIGQIKGRVKFSVISHSRINKDLSLICSEFTDDADYGLYLLFGTEITGVDGIKSDVLLFPVRSNFLQFSGKIFTGKVLEHGMCTENCSRKNDCFIPHRTQKGQRYSKRAFTKAGYVLNGQNSFHNHLIK